MEDPHELKILGSKIRTFRKSRLLTIKDLAERVVCTTAYISQIENGIASPSISMLKSIANALNVKLVDFFINDGDFDDDIVIRKGGGYKIKYPMGNASISLLTKTLDGKNMEPLLKVLEPKTGSDGLYSHSGSQEFGYVISGTFDLLIEDKVYKLQRGDSFYFNSSRPHGFANNEKKPAVILWVISPPTY